MADERSASLANSAGLAEADDLAASDGLAEFESQIQQAIDQVSAATVGFGGGSGVVVSSEGLLLSVAHVAKRPGRRLRVTFPDGRRTTARVLGVCDDLDIALAQIVEPGPWPAVEIRRVETPAEQSWLLKLGYPVSFQHGQPPAVRVGCLLRNRPDAFISDCPIMGGDSGGPVFDLAGNLVGISSRCQDEVDFNLHIPLATYFRHWDALCSARELHRGSDGALRPKRPDWEVGFGNNLAGQPQPFPGELPESSPLGSPARSYAARRPAVADLNPSRDSATPVGGRQADRYVNRLAAARQAARQATVELRQGPRTIAAGTLLSDAEVSEHLSYVATKASLLGSAAPQQAWQVQLPGEPQPRPASWLDSDEDSDLAVLAIELAPRSPAVSGTEPDTDTASELSSAPGSPVVTISAAGQPVVGFVSSTPRSFAMRQPPLLSGRAMLGVSVTPHANGVRVTDVVERSGAERAGLQVGDLVQSVDGRSIRSADELVSVIAKKRVGDRLPLEVLRKDETRQLEAVLGAFRRDRRHRHSFDNWGGGPFSDRRFEIPHVLPHDTPLAPDDCGSPLVDRHGRVIGVNIARALRTTSYALPIEDVWQAISRWQQL
ncbi:trypsin-like peptidase domain-containing protein [Roseimaritima sediminicola]|uniref:trypsin-like peptidase domain-containing protein n=1 Tax=Roseimaritima sediminicola TaxID=2662066 RepID=UPI001386CACA|nr:trypsin-like peptidase domain-containing protein [Roseimaritima sediminicola]